MTLARLAKLRVTTIVMLEAFDAQQVRAEWHHHCGGEKAGIELGENGSTFPRPKGKAR
jgi:hypothetical protein